MHPPLSEFMWTRANAVYGVIWAVVIIGAYRAGAWRRFFSTAPLRFVGRVSFSVYLLHRPVLEMVAGWKTVPTSMKGLVVLAISLIAAWACHKLIEAPGMRVGRRLAASIRLPRIAVT
jgi:peptidoglycan/LPS O-acetylase OafA/YrhL